MAGRWRSTSSRSSIDEEVAMTGDAARRQPEMRRSDAWSLPKVVALEVRRARFKEPLRRYVTPQDVAEYAEAIEFDLTTSAELPIRAYPPVLYVGDVMVSDFEQLGREHYVFRAFDFDALPTGAPISLGWPRRADGRRATKFRYDRPPAPRG
jgi:hypothetical protein